MTLAPAAPPTGALAALLDALVGVVEQQSPDLLCSVLLRDGARLRHGAAPRLPAAYNRAIDGIAVGPAVGSCGTAAYRGERVVVADIAADPLWADFRDLAAAHGLRACWSAPIRGADRAVLGTFALYYREPRHPTPADLQLIDAAAQLAAVIRERHHAAAERERLLTEAEAARTALERANRQLQTQATELAAGADALRGTAARLAEQTAAAEAGRAAGAAILEGTADAYILLDRDFRVAAVNGAMERGAGWPRARLVGGEFWTLFPGARGTVFEREYRRVAAGGEAAHFTHDYSDGRLELVVEVDAYPAAGGGVAVFWRDITARARLEAALRASEARFRTLQDVSPDGSALFTAMRDPGGAVVDFRVAYVNAAATRILTGGDEPLVGRTLREAFPESVGAGRLAMYAHVVETGAPWQQDVAYTRAGVRRGLRVNAVKVDDGVHLAFADVTAHVAAAAERERLLAESEQARAEAETARGAAEAASRAKSEFLAVMSHELRTPLNAIGGYAQLLDMGLHGPVTDAQRTALGRVQKAQAHLLGLINDVLNYARLEAGRVEYALGVVDVRDVIADVAPLLEPQLAAKGLALDVRLPDGPCAVWTDPDKLGQVLLNLLSNAAKFTDARHAATGAPGHVTVDVATRPGHGRDDAVFLRVRDTGRGIPRDKQGAIFEPFVQVRAGPGSGYAQAREGTGLGLAISRDLARGMGGDLRVRSREGEGSTFTVTLRRAAPGAAPESVDGAAAGAPAGADAPGPGLA